MHSQFTVFHRSFVQINKIVKLFTTRYSERYPKKEMIIKFESHDSVKKIIIMIATTQNKLKKYVKMKTWQWIIKLNFNVLSVYSEWVLQCCTLRRLNLLRFALVFRLHESGMKTVIKLYFDLLNSSTMNRKKIYSKSSLCQSGIIFNVQTEKKFIFSIQS